MEEKNNGQWMLPFINRAVNDRYEEHFADGRFSHIKENKLSSTTLTLNTDIDMDRRIINIYYSKERTKYVCGLLGKETAPAPLTEDDINLFKNILSLITDAIQPLSIPHA